MIFLTKPKIIPISEIVGTALFFTSFVSNLLLFYSLFIPTEEGIEHWTFKSNRGKNIFCQLWVFTALMKGGCCGALLYNYIWGILPLDRQIHLILFMFQAGLWVHGLLLALLPQQEGPGFKVTGKGNWKLKAACTCERDLPLAQCMLGRLQLNRILKIYGKMVADANFLCHLLNSNPLFSPPACFYACVSLPRQ